MTGRPLRPSGGDGPAASPGDGPAATHAAVLVEHGDGETRIAVIGEVDLSNAEVVEQQVLRAAAGEPAALTLDLTDLRYIDSAGLWILFRLGARLSAARVVGEVVVPAGGPVRRMIETAGVSAAIPVRRAPA